jgi:hypothetical protein
VDLHEFIWGGLAVLYAVGSVSARAARAGRAARAAALISPTVIAKVPEGATVRIAGTVKLLEQSLIAPFSGSRCAGYFATCKGDGHFEHGHAAGRSGIHRVSRERWCAFVLEDATGKALVQVGEEVVVEGTRLPSPSVARREQVSAFLEFNKFRQAAGSDGFTPEEWTLSEDDVVTVVGTARWERDPDPEGNHGSGYRTAPRRLVVCAPAMLPLKVIVAT